MAPVLFYAFDKRRTMRKTLLGLLLVGACNRPLPELEDAHRDLSDSLAVFPGAEGFGTDTVAGRSGALLRVTTLAPDGPGSLKEALETPGPRTIVFEVAGTIALTENIRILEPFLTVAGQTAPGPGITIIGAGFEISTHDVLIQNLRIRVGDAPEGPKAKNRDSVAIVGSKDGSLEAFNVVIDRCSLSWGVDETASTTERNVRDITYSNNLISESLAESIHPEGSHSKGLLVGDHSRRVSLLRNVFAHNDDRNPFLKGDTSALIANNLVYDYGRWPVGFNDREGSGPSLAAVQSNLFLQGPSSPLDHHTVLVMRFMKEGTRIFLEDISSFDATSDPASLVEQESARDFFLVEAAPVSVKPLTLLPASQLESALLPVVGASPRDSIDARVISQIEQRTGKIINSPAEVGGFLTLEETRQAFVAPQDPNADDDADGYTNLEEVLHALLGL